ncbi:hypothetical protein [Micromonospora mirobrigensis]|uniref:hypothetical protein n=1 Tax=Micromonospora mirobrigensis TaxID=262898 RepID=UPI000B808B49|nr:hypothetical protein [Micromonospora mirobrigensis]
MSVDPILPPLIAEVLRARYPGIDVQAVAPGQEILPPESRPAIRVRGQRGPRTQDGVIASRLLVVAFGEREPLTLSPVDLTDAASAMVLPPLMTALPGVDLRLRERRAPEVRHNRGRKLTLHHWCASASLTA